MTMPKFKARSIRRNDNATFFWLAVFLWAVALVLLRPAAGKAVEDNTPRGESRFAKLDGARIHYLNYGKGDEALVLIHGWTMNADNWRDNIADLAARNRVIVIELPGHGQSDKPEQQKSEVSDPRSGRDSQAPPLYSMEHFAQAVDAVMRDAKVKRAVLVGHSMGTPVARQFYRKYPEKTLGIVLVDGSLRPFDKAMMDQMIANFRGPKYRDAVSQLFGMMFGPGLTPEAQQRIKASTESTPQYVLANAFAGMAEPSIWGEDKINVPVLAIMAKNPFYSPNVAESFRALAPNIDFQMWDGVGHFIMMEKPKEFDAAVIAWLDKNGLLKSRKQ